MSSTRDKIKQFFSQFQPNARVLVIINADPDAIASAMAVKRLLWRKVSEVVITHFNQITRPDNLTLIQLTDAGLRPLAQVDRSQFDHFVIVDSQPDHNEAFAGISYAAIIDHHPLTDAKAGYTDIRPGYGTCATILTEYLKSWKIKPSAKLAAALMLGIKTDTADFTRQATGKDIRAFQYLYKFADTNIVTKVERAILTDEDLNFIGNAIKKRQKVNNRVFYHAGKISKPDELVVVADFFLSIAGVNWSIISGVMDRQLIVILRNDGLRKGAGNTAKEAFSKYGSAGGHKTMARAELPLHQIKKETGRIGQKFLAQWVMAQIEKNAGKKIE
jgi:nanoRNase/pAp phosphatase (c-di-AMP/oligoRNAs hydrolase)